MSIRSATLQWIAAGALCLLPLGTANAQRALVKNLATGIQDDTGEALPARVHDVDWRWDGPTTTRYPFVIAGDVLPEAFLPDEASFRSRWIYEEATGSGAFHFETAVDLAGFAPASARIVGLRIAADNWLGSVSLNGVTLFDAPAPAGEGADYGGFVEVGAGGAGHFVEGRNIIRVTVHNDPHPILDTNPIALRLEGWVEAERIDPPEPASFEGLGDLPGGDAMSHAYALSADGSTVVGTSSSSLGASGEAFRWRREHGMEPLGCVSNYCSTVNAGVEISSARGVSADGEIVAGMSSRTTMGLICSLSARTAMFTYSDESGHVVELTLNASPHPGFSWAPEMFAFSADATAIAGNLGIRPSVSSCNFSGYLGGWAHEEGATTILPDNLVHGLVWPQAISADGEVLVGFDVFGRGGVVWSWREGGGEPTVIDGLRAFGVSADARFVVGVVPKPGPEYPVPARPGAPGIWSMETGLRVLDFPAGGSGEAVVVSIDGRWVLGRATREATDAALWIDEGPGQPLQEWLEDEAGLDLTGWKLTEAIGLSNDRRTIAGNGTNPVGEREAWVVTLPYDAVVCRDAIAPAEGEECVQSVPEPASWLGRAVPLLVMLGLWRSRRPQRTGI